MKRKLLLIGLLAGCCVGMSADDKDMIVVRLQDMANLRVRLTQSAVVRFKGDDVEFSSGKSDTKTIQFAVLKNMKFEKSDPIGIADAVKTADRPVFSIHACVLSLTGAKPNSRISLYGLDGRLRQSATTDSDGTVSFTLPDETAVFIVKTPTHTFKLIRE